MFVLPLLGLALAAPAYPASAPPAVKAESDTVFSVARGTRIRAETMEGDIRVQVWDRNQVRVEARHSDRDRVRVRQSGSVLRIETTGGFGPHNDADYDLTVPVWMALTLEGMNGDITVDGVRAPLEITTLNGDITVTGGSELVRLSSTSGDIRLTGARGRVVLNGTSQDIFGTDIQGDLVVESISADIVLRGIVSRSVDVQNVSGTIWFDGAFQEGGRYRLLNHSGSIYAGLAENANATILMAVFSGSIRAGFRLPTPLTDDIRPQGRRQSFRFGNGSASVELEAFSGSIVLLRPAELAARMARTNRDH